MKPLHSLSLALLCVAHAAAQDVTVSRLGNDDDIRFWGSSGGRAAYSFATTSCNLGSIPIPWNPNNKSAPVIGSNLYRIKDGRIEHLSYAFVKYGLCSLDSDANGCPGNCTDNTSGCDQALDPGCADVYSANLNDGKQGGAKWEIGPVTGQWPAGTPTGPSGDATLRGRIQPLVSEISDPADVYLIEGQYLSGADHLAGNARNNYGWRQVLVAGNLQMTKTGGTALGTPGIYAWQAFADDVLVTDLAVEDEGGTGVHGWAFLASRAIDLGNGEWRYEYAVQNGNTARGIGTFSVPLPCDAQFAISSTFFRGVTHHSGSPYSNAPWTFQQLTDRAEWATEDFATNPNASAVRWGELYSFGFTANRAPAGGRATVGLFVPGTPTELLGDVIAPGALFTHYCSANPNSTGNPAALAAAGSSSLQQNELSFAVTDLPVQTFGYFLMSQTQAFVGNFGGSQGNLCLGAQITRFSDDVLDSGVDGQVSFAVDVENLPNFVVFSPGDTWNFQYWYRDVNPTQTSNTTAGVSVTFCN